MAIAWVIASLVLLGLVLWDGFETMVLPRRVTRRLRLTRIFYRGVLGSLRGSPCDFPAAGSAKAFSASSARYRS